MERAHALARAVLQRLRVHHRPARGRLPRGAVLLLPRPREDLPQAEGAGVIYRVGRVVTAVVRPMQGMYELTSYDA